MSNEIKYDRTEEQFCMRCKKPCKQLVSADAFNGEVLGFICTECGLVWHFDNTGAPCAHGEISQTQIKTATRYVSPEEMAKEKEVLERVLKHLEPEAVAALYHETKMWDAYWRIER